MSKDHSPRDLSRSDVKRRWMGFLPQAVFAWTAAVLTAWCCGAVVAAEDPKESAGGQPNHPAKVAATENQSPSLPFSIKVTEEKIDNLPDYMSDRNPVGMDFPYCPVTIDGEFWVMHNYGSKEPVFRYKGTNIENAVRQPDGKGDLPMKTFIHGKGDLPSKPYILGGVWYDAGEKKLYAPLHYEIHGFHPTALREIHLASSIDKGLNWKYEGAIIASNDPKNPRKGVAEFSGSYYDGGDGDQLLYVDERGGYFYVFTDHYTWPKTQESPERFSRHCVARCAIADKMAPGKWWKFYNGEWNQPGLGGKASYVNGYCVTYNSYLKKYISFNYLSGISFCDDLSKQEWSPSIRLGSFWGCNNPYFAFWPTNAEKNDTAQSGQDLFVYSFFRKRARDGDFGFPWARARPGPARTNSLFR